MRAGLFLEALAADHEVSLLVVPVSGPAPEAWPAFVQARTARRVCLDLTGYEDPVFQSAAADGPRQVAALRAYPRPALARFAGTAAVRAASRELAGPRFDVVHVFRLYLAPFVDVTPGPTRAVLDLDDDEVETRGRIAALHATCGDPARMVLEAAEAEKYRRLEREWLDRFDRVLVCGERDRASVAERTGHPRVQVIPNGVRPPEPADGGEEPRDPAFRLLFVGTLGYFPNVDAATTLCRDVLPRVRACASREIAVDLVGARPAPAVGDLARLPGVELHADVSRVAPFYARAGAVVVALRAGGGTRIKLLEAFTHGVPVVSTSAGAEGLEVEPERHLLIGDDPDRLAEACRRLWAEPALANRLRPEGLRLVAARYDAERVMETIRAFARDVLTVP